MHFPASLLIVSLTTMGLMSGGQPSLFVFRAIEQPSAKNFDTEVGTFPAAKVLTTCLRKEPMGVGSGIMATSSIQRPEGAATVSLGNDRRTERILKSG